MRPTDHDPRTPFDHEADHRADVSEEFWGDARGWGDRTPRRGTPVPPRDDTTGTMRAIRDGVAAFRPQRIDRRDATGQMRRTRQHGSGRPAVQPTAPQTREHASIGELAAGDFDDPIHRDVRDHGALIHDVPHAVTTRQAARDDAAWDAWLDDDPSPIPAASDPDLVGHDPDDVPLTTVGRRSDRIGLGAVDPLLARFGALALVGVMLVPVAMSLRPSGSDANTVRIESPTATELVDATVPADAVGAGTSQVGAEPAIGAAAPSGSVDDAASASQSAPVAAAPESAATSSDTESGDAAPAESASVAEAPSAAIADDAATDGIDEPATVDAAAERIVPQCPQTYTASSGDSWYRIADAAGVPAAAVLGENRATNDTVILPGDDICLPADATIPSPPAPPADPEPQTTAAPTTTATPATTTAPTTTVAPAAPASVEEVKALIRRTWPAEEHETALRIADRESRFNPRADNNWCCYGVFQIYFTVHQSWLADFGVDTAADLFDAEKNIAAAYHLYEQSGGWGPWGF